MNINNNDKSKPIFSTGVMTNKLIANTGSINNFESIQSQINTINVNTLNVSKSIDISGNLILVNKITNTSNTEIGYNLAVITSSAPSTPDVINSGIVSLCQGYELAFAASRGNTLVLENKNFFGIYPDAQNNGNFNPISKVGDHILFTGLYGNQLGPQSDGGIVICPWSNTLSGMRMDASGNFTIATETQSTDISDGSFVVSGGVGIGGNLNVGGTTTSTIFTTSDYRIKENIKLLDNTYITDNLNPIKYTNKQNSRTEIGFLAHELEKEYPYLVSGEKDGETLQSVNYIGLIGILVNEIKLLKARVEILEGISK